MCIAGYCLDFNSNASVALLVSGEGQMNIMKQGTNEVHKEHYEDMKSVRAQRTL